MEAPVIRPLTASRWRHFEQLFGDNGACGGCWCMFWRITRKEFASNKGAGNRNAMRALVESNARPGLLAYRDEQPIGWCSVARRPEFPSIARSRLFKNLTHPEPREEAKAWSVTCLFVHRQHRRSGVSVALLRAAIEHARKQRAASLDGYPTEPRTDKIADAFAWTGVASAFAAAGFREVARPSPTRPVMRYDF